MASSQNILLKSSDGEFFVVDRNFAKFAAPISIIFDNYDVDQIDVTDQEKAIPLSNVNGATFRKILQWIQNHQNDPAALRGGNGQMTRWDAHFLRQMDRKMLFDVISAANFLDIQRLFGVACRYVAKKMEHGIRRIKIRSDIFDIPKESLERREALSEYGRMQNHCHTGARQSDGKSGYMQPEPIIDYLARPTPSRGKLGCGPGTGPIRRR